MDLISDEEARLSLRLGPSGSDENDDADLAAKITQASDIYLTYHPLDDAWTDDTVSPAVTTIPESVKAATIIILHSLWDNRGEDPIDKAYPLMRLNRGPAIA